MKVLLINRIHHKNLNALINYKKIDFTIINTISEIDKYDLEQFNCVYSPSDPINTSLYPNIKFIFGPHFSVFPFNNLEDIKYNNSIYIQPSEWSVNIWKNNSLCNNLTIKNYCFGVDTEIFKPSNIIRNKVFIYFKNRNPKELYYIEKFLNNKNIEYKVFSYKEGYNENNYLEYLKQSKYGIWIGCHESQGFALEEALSCNVPLLVWNVKYMSQEYKCNYPNYSATSIPYWDSSCGEFFYNIHDMYNTFVIFIENINNNKYNPREYILKNLSIEVCEKEFIKLIENIKI